jgi:alpha-1,6-mannosyltransferase
MVQLNVKGDDILPYSCERRRILGNLFAFELSWQVGRQFGGNVSTAFAIITATQFHLLFYLSRPLPNVFALALGK